VCASERREDLQCRQIVWARTKTHIRCVGHRQAFPKLITKVPRSPGEMKTWIDVCKSLGVERTEEQSPQRIQQYSVRLKVRIVFDDRWASLFAERVRKRLEMDEDSSSRCLLRLSLWATKRLLPQRSFCSRPRPIDEGYCRDGKWGSSATWLLRTLC
jgi:hypothetical protein